MPSIAKCLALALAPGARLRCILPSIRMEPFDRLKSVLADRYTVEKQIGSGGMATSITHDVRHNRRSAIKVYASATSRRSSVADRFLRGDRDHREAAAPASTSCPLFDSGSRRRHGLSTSRLYVAGRVAAHPARSGDTAPARRRAPHCLTESRRRASTTPTATGVVHRGIKPDNVSLSRRPRPLLADFGISLPERRPRHAAASA